MTVTVGAITPGRPAGLHVRCNRDEQRTRSHAEPPAVRRVHGHDVLMPRDPDGGGTWILANAHGLVACLLNRNLPEAAAPAAPIDPISRGLVPPAIAGATTLDEAIAAVHDRGPDPRRLRPFRLVLAAPGGETAEWVHEGARLVPVRRGPTHREAWLATSSGLGDHLVEGPRGRRFAELVLTSAEPGGDVSAALDRFHRESWPDAPHLAPWMDRDDAWTSSYTEVVVDDGRVTMRHEERSSGDVSVASIEQFVTAPGGGG